MLERINYLGFKKIYKQLKDSYKFEKYLRAIRQIEEKVPFTITNRLNFSGKYAIGTKEFLLKLGRKGIELEVNSFLSEAKTDLGIEILETMVKLLLTDRNLVKKWNRS
jgi:hypothetical protein